MGRVKISCPICKNRFFIKIDLKNNKVVPENCSKCSSKIELNRKS